MPGQKVPLTFHAGDEGWTFEGVVNHLILFSEDNPTSQTMLLYPVTVRFVDGTNQTLERHTLECKFVEPSGIWLRFYPDTTPAAGLTSAAPS